MLTNDNWVIAIDCNPPDIGIKSIQLLGDVEIIKKNKWFCIQNNNVYSLEGDGMKYIDAPIDTIDIL